MLVTGDEPEWAEKAKAFSSKVKDLSEFLIDIGWSPRGHYQEKSPYHDHAIWFVTRK